MTRVSDFANYYNIINNDDKKSVDEIHANLMIRVNELYQDNIKLRSDLLKFSSDKLDIELARRNNPAVEDAWTKFQLIYNLTKEN